jgi:hypothetical protein
MGKDMNLRVGLLVIGSGKEEIKDNRGVDMIKAYYMHIFKISLKTHYFVQLV